MKQNVMLTIASLLSILFMTLHLTSDTVHARVGTAEAGGSTLIAVPILVVWLHGTLVLAERRSGYIIMLVGSLLASGMPVIHVMVFFSSRSRHTRFDTGVQTCALPI